MLSRTVARAAASAAAPTSGARALTTTIARQGSTPSMGDVNPSSSSVETFNKKQKQFREQLAEAQKERDARAFKSTPSDTSKSEMSGSGSPTGSTGRKAEVNEKETDRKSGPLTNLIYGTKEGREMEAQMEASFSQVLARGKYVHSIVTHEVKPDKVDEYVKLIGKVYPRMANNPENRVNLVGSWRTEVGDCDTFGMFACVASAAPVC